jgi:nicotinamide phosphoribosyltransferase
MYRQIFEKWAKQTAPEAIGFVPWQGHDFSFRGHFCKEAATVSGAAHLLAFTGTDTLPAIDFLEEYYNANVDEELVGGSVSATEHSVACMNSVYLDGVPDDFGYFERMITEVYPSGIISLVADTFDFWNCVDPDGGIIATLKDKILARDGKVVIRPDSGDPVKIVTGYTEDEIVRNGPSGIHVKEPEIGGGYNLSRNPITELEVKGMVQCLWEIFGGTESTTGYRLLDSHIGAIYGDSITLERAEQICQRLADKGFASTNVVFGIGSFTYQGAVTRDAIVTRDTHMFAVKSTYGEVLKDGQRVGVEIFKDPKTDSGMKKSAKGLTAVYEQDGEFVLKDQATWDEVKNCAFVQVFSDGKITKDWTLAEVRANVAKNF